MREESAPLFFLCARFPEERLCDVLPEFLRNIPLVNLQALFALVLFGVSLFLAHMAVNIQSGKWPGSQTFVTYLRVVLGFTFAASIGLGIYSFAGVNLLFK